MRVLLPLLFSLLCTCVSAQKTFPTPVNDIVTDRASVQSAALPQAPLRAADVMWQKRVWRVIDTREKINLTFAYPERPLITILMEAAQDEKIQLYSTLDDKFTTPLSPEALAAIAGPPDTVAVVHPTTQALSYEIVPRELNPAEFTRYRLQEVWYFDKASSTTKVRILGIAPIRDVFDENGTLMYEQPAFWVYYPAAREMLATEMTFAVGNDAANQSWEDIFEMRYFNSAIVKESNIHNRRIGDYLPNGRDRLLESERVKADILARESDSWSH